jgi:hypothetical protein
LILFKIINNILFLTNHFNFAICEILLIFSRRAKFLINNVITSRFGFEKNNNGYPSRPNSLTGNSEVISANVLIPKENCGSLVGKGGENIKSLQVDEFFSIETLLQRLHFRNILASN